NLGHPSIIGVTLWTFSRRSERIFEGSLLCLPECHTRIDRLERARHRPRSTAHRMRRKELLHILARLDIAERRRRGGDAARRAGRALFDVAPTLLRGGPGGGAGGGVGER